jgi:Trypsin-like peptidase domain
VALGYPLSGLLAGTASLSVGNVSALAGLGDDTRFLQISAPVQPGNSGGPLLDASGHLIGIVTGKLDVIRLAPFLRDIPQNVNFALKAEVVRIFLDSMGIVYQGARSEQQLSPADVGDIGRPLTVHIACEHPAVSGTAPSPEPQQRTEPKYQVSRNLNLHALPNAKSPNLLSPWSPGYIPQGTKFVGEPKCILEGAGAGWCKITYNHDDLTTTGWANGWLLEKLKYRASRNLNLHESPDAKSTNLLSPWSPDYIPQGTEFGEPNCLLEGAGAGWCKITFNHHHGVATIGWVNGWLLERIP